MSDVKIEHKETMSREAAATWLSLLSRAFAADGHVELPLGPSEIEVLVPDLLRAELEVEVDGDEVEIEVEFSWSTAELKAAAAAGQQKLSTPAAQQANGARRTARAARR